MDLRCFVHCFLDFAVVSLYDNRRCQFFAQPLRRAVIRLAIGICASKGVLQQQSFQEMQELSALLVSFFRADHAGLSPYLFAMTAPIGVRLTLLTIIY